MLSKIQSYWVVFFTAVFVVSNSILIANEFYWLNLIPLILAIVLLAFLSLEYLLLIIAFFTPLSISLEGLDLGGISMFYNILNSLWEELTRFAAFIPLERCQNCPAGL